jgi:hypothetical protein
VESGKLGVGKRKGNFPSRILEDAVPQSWRHFGLNPAPGLASEALGNSRGIVMFQNYNCAYNL